MYFISLIVYHQPWKNGQTCSQDNPGIVCAQDEYYKPVMQYVFELTVKLLQFSSWKIQCRHSTWCFCLQWVSSKKKKKRSKHLTQRPFETKRNYFPQMWVTCRFDTTSIHNVIISYNIIELDQGKIIVSLGLSATCTTGNFKLKYDKQEKERQENTISCEMRNVMRAWKSHFSQKQIGNTDNVFCSVIWQYEAEQKSESVIIKILEKQIVVILLMKLKPCSHTSVKLRSITTQNEVDASLKITKTDRKCTRRNALIIEAQPRQLKSLKADMCRLYCCF